MSMTPYELAGAIRRASEVVVAVDYADDDNALIFLHVTKETARQVVLDAKTEEVRAIRAYEDSEGCLWIGEDDDEGEEFGDDGDEPLEDEFMVHIDLGGAAMSSPNDVADALMAVAARLRNGDREGGVRDANGNDVGRFEFAMAEGGQDDS